MSEMTFYIEEVLDGDPPPEPPPDDGEGGGFDPSDFLDLGDLTGGLPQASQEEVGEEDNEDDEDNINDDDDDDGDDVSEVSATHGNTRGDSTSGSGGPGAAAAATKKKRKKGRKGKGKGHAAAAAARPKDPFVGTHVELHGLLAKPELNGARGTVLALRPDTGR